MVKGKSNLFVAFLCVLMAFSLATMPFVSATVESRDFVINPIEGNEISVDGEAIGILGDTDCDNVVNVKDATKIQKSIAYIVTLDEVQTLLADVDVNEVVSIKDATSIQKWLAGMEVEFLVNHLLYYPDNQGSATEGTASGSTEASVPVETQPVTDPTCSLQFSKYGRYTGAYVEDGTDEYVQNVAVIMITNISQKYLEYAVATFDISGTPAAFTVTGLAPGETVWALEQNRLTIEKDAEFTYVDDVTAFADYEPVASSPIKVKLGDGQLTAANNTNKDYKNVYVYYKLRHTDGNFLGGITYRVAIGDLASGKSASAVAVHCDGVRCEVVRIDWEG